MKTLMVILLIMLLASGAFSAENSLASKLFSQDAINLEIAGSGMTAAGSPSRQAVNDADELNPGKALLLSAILPGAGQYSIGSNWKAAIFLTIEIAAWTGVIYYYNAGQDKDGEFKDYADEHFAESIYRTIEFDLARSPQWGDSGTYTGTEPEWIEETWDTKISYLPSQGFTHEMPTQEERNANKNDDQQYYEMIGKYIHQFGFGWDDAYGDDAGTPWFDGSSPNSVYYMDMRHESNTLLDYSSLAIQIAMLNHVASALDASFTVRAMKRKARAKVSFRDVRYNDKQVLVGGLSLRW